MGAYLNKPITEAESEEGGNDRVKFAATSMQGWRINQEDAHNCIANYRDDWAMFAVYDGHGGPEVAKYTADNFPSFLLKREFWEKDNDELTALLQETFVDWDEHLRSDAALKQLKVVAGRIKEKKGEDETDEDKAKMYEEGSIPLQELLARYGVQIIKGGGKVLGSTLLEGADEDVDSEEEEIVDEEEEKETVDTEETDDKKKCMGKRSCESPIQDEAKRPKTDEKNDTAEVEDGVEKNGDSKEEKENSETALDGEVAPKMRGKKVKEPKVIEKKEAIEASGDSSEDDDDYDEEGEMEEDEESEEDEADESDECVDPDDYGPQGETPGEDSGTTACVCLVSNKKIYVANVGDSRAVLCRSGKAVDLSFDHKPEDPVEISRIQKAGGRVTEEGRVNGGLNLSRAFGDHCYKKNSELSLAEQMISAFPDVKSEEITPEDRFMIVACDGIWNSMDSQQVIDFIKERFDNKCELKQICEELCNACLADSTAGDGTGCDNMTVIIADLSNALAGN